MNILVTGGTGFIGSHLLHHLVKNKSYNLFALTRCTSNLWRIDGIKDKLTLLPIKTTFDLENVFQKNTFDLIIHLATNYIKYEKTTTDIIQMNDDNIEFPSRLLQLAVENGVKAFINTGTCFEYRLSSHPLTEKSPISPYNYYAATKVAYEDLLRYYTAQRNINAVTLKLFYPYGEKDNEKLLVQIMHSLLANQTITISKGEQKLNFTYVSDIVKAYEKTMKYILSNEYNGYSIFNIGQTEAHSIKYIAKLMEKITKKKDLISLSRPYSVNEIMYMKSNCIKAKDILQWEPSVTIEEGLTKMRAYYSQQL